MLLSDLVSNSYFTKYTINNEKSIYKLYNLVYTISKKEELQKTRDYIGTRLKLQALTVQITTNASLSFSEQFSFYKIYNKKMKNQFTKYKI